MPRIDNAPPLTMPQHLGRYMRRTRQARGESQAKVGERLAVSQFTVSQWERGLTVPDFVQWIDFSRAYRADPCEATREILDSYATATPLFGDLPHDREG